MTSGPDRRPPASGRDRDRARGGLAFFATAAKGTEGALRDELREIRVPGVRADRGGVHFSGGWDDAWRACLHSRVAVRVLAELGRFEAPDGAALYEGVRAIDFSPYLTPRHTLAVSAAVRSGGLTHTGFVAQKTKDAIVDRIRDAVGSRPDVDRRDPDVAVFVHIVKDRATVYLDLAGESLHRRGYRVQAGEAPLKETLAAAILRLAGWDRASPLHDPMCGSGTFPIEASLWALRVAPGLLRRRFGFERWAMHDVTAASRMADLREGARMAVRADAPPISGADADPAAIAVARANARRAGVAVRFTAEPVSSLRPLAPGPSPAPSPGAGFVVVNPPYGARMEADRTAREDLAAAIRRLRGHTVAILSGAPDIERAMALRPDVRHSLWNGDIECRLLVYRMR